MKTREILQKFTMGKTSEEHGRIEVRSTYSEYHRFESRAINLVASKSVIERILRKTAEQ